MKIKYLKVSFLFLIILFAFLACAPKQAEKGELVTERIQYDVNIISPDSENPKWWADNLEGSKREAFVNKIIEVALSGKVKLYNPFDDAVMTVDDLRNMLHRVDTVVVKDSEPPYLDKDTIVTKNISNSDINMIRYLEEWYMDSKTLKIEKKILGICPLIPYFTSSGEYLGKKPLFWIYFDEKYPLKN